MLFRISKEKQKRFRPVFWGLVLVLAAVVLILDNLGIKFGYGINAWRIVVGVLLVAWLVSVVLYRRFPDIFIPICLLFLVFQGPIAHAIDPEKEELLPVWVAIVATVLLTVGFNVILKPAYSGFLDKKSKSGADVATDTAQSRVLYYNADRLDGAVIRDQLGFVQVYINNKNAYPGSAVVTITDNLGKIVLHIPAEWDVIAQTGSNIGKVEIPTHTGNGISNVTLVVNDNVGSVQVVFDN